MSAVERSTTVDASPDDVWAVLADFGEIATWVPMIEHSCLLSEQADDVGAARRVQIGRQTLIERITQWAPPQTLAYDIDGLPPIVGAARNTWQVTPSGPRCEVVLRTEIDAGHNPVKLLIARSVLARMAQASEMMLAGLAAALTATPTTKEEDR